MMGTSEQPASIAITNANYDSRILTFSSNKGCHYSFFFFFFFFFNVGVHITQGKLVAFLDGSLVARSSNSYTHWALNSGLMWGADRVSSGVTMERPLAIFLLHLAGWRFPHGDPTSTTQWVVQTKFFRQSLIRSLEAIQKTLTGSSNDV